MPSGFQSLVSSAIFGETGYILDQYRPNENLLGEKHESEFSHPGTPVPNGIVTSVP